jgi:hypothetical protein
LTQLILLEPPAAAPDARFDSVSAFARRLIDLAFYGSTPTREGAVLEVLAEIGRRPGRLILRDEGDSVEILYVAPPRLRATIAARAEQAGWDPRVLKKQRGAFRSSAGAIIQLPVEGGGEVETFITDWSPFPAAAAIAVHPDHPLGGAACGFSGRFARNPLTMDLLPVWVAEWVKPEFGTGAVVLNPAHDATDLAYARRIGLPIRFALLEDSAAPGSGNWPEPPIVKRGVSARSGVADGLQVSEAQAAYFAVMKERGAIEAWTDWSIPAIPLAAIPRSGLPWGATTGTAARLVSELAGNEGVAAAPVLRALANGSDFADTCIVASSANVEGPLLHLRLLYEDLRGHPLEPKHMITAQKAADTVKATGPANSEAGQLGLLICGPIEQPGTVRQQTLEQAAAFLRGDRELRQQVPMDEGTERDALSPAILAAVEKWDFVRLFQVTYDAQKAIRANRDCSAPTVTLYRQGAFLLMGK